MIQPCAYVHGKNNLACYSLSSHSFQFFFFVCYGKGYNCLTLHNLFFAISGIDGQMSPVYLAIILVVNVILLKQLLVGLWEMMSPNVAGLFGRQLVNSGCLGDLARSCLVSTIGSLIYFNAFFTLYICSFSFFFSF